MEHHFNTVVAQYCGVKEAVMLTHIAYWVRVNEIKGANFRDGLYWTYNTIKEFHLQFPYLSEKQIRTALKNLEDKGLVQTGTYNKDGRDRTLWYTITPKARAVLGEPQEEAQAQILRSPEQPVDDCPSGNLSLPKREIETSHLGNCGCPNGQSITIYKTTDIRIPDIRTPDISSTAKAVECRLTATRRRSEPDDDNEQDEKQASVSECRAVIDAYNATCVSLKKASTVLTDKRKGLIRARLKEYGMDGMNEIFRKAEASDFLAGRTPRSDAHKSWKPDFNWLILPNNAVKVYEGRYDNPDVSSSEESMDWYVSEETKREFEEVYGEAW